MAFEGFAPTACDWFGELARNNTKAWFTENRAVHTAGVVAPMQALLDEAQMEFGGETKIFRPHRDVRFSKDKSPYHLHQRGLIHSIGVMAIYVALDAEGFYAGMGAYGFQPDRLKLFRDVIAGDGGAAFGDHVARIEAAGLVRSGETLRTAPRGFAADHPRIDLLRHKGIAFGGRIGPSDVEDANRVRSFSFTVWNTVKPAADWLSDQMGQR